MLQGRTNHNMEGRLVLLPVAPAADISDSAHLELVQAWCRKANRSTNIISSFNPVISSLRI